MFEELGPGAFRLHYDSLDFNAGLVVGSGTLLIDTRSSPLEAAELRTDLKRLAMPKPRMVVNTHHHWDHAFGNQTFVPAATIYGHPECRRRLIEEGEGVRRRLIRQMPERKDEFAEVVITPPDVLIPDRTTLDPGQAPATVRYLGRGHTDNDLVVMAGDVLFAGDLVEEGAPPSFDDSYPVSWSGVLREIAGLGCSVVVPAHGNVVDPAFVEGLAEQMELVASLAAGSIAEARPIDQIPTGGLDLPPAVARTALMRAYLELGKSSEKSR